MSEKEVHKGDEDDGNWIFDSLVNFLHGPIWKLPVIGFIEEKSVVFDPDSYKNESEEKELEFHKIHDEYKTLVDFMLSNLMEDIGVTPEQVESACQGKNDLKHLSLVTKSVFEQLTAAEDFSTFKRIMTRKNIDLQLQSLELLVSKYGVLSPSLTSSADGTTSGNEDDFLLVVLSQLSKQNSDEEVEAEGGEKLTKKDELKKKKEKKSLIEAIIETRLENEDEEENRIEISEITASAPLEHQILTSVRRALDEEEEEDKKTEELLKKELLDISTKKQEVSEEDIERRREYFKSQRDKLIAIKKSEREKLINSHILDENNSFEPGSSKGGLNKRPKSSKAAQDAINSKGQLGSNTKSLAARKALALRLKYELDKTE